MRFFLIVVVFLGVYLPVSIGQAQQATIPMEIYLAIGQSNMAGRADIPSKHAGELAGVFLYTGDEFTPWIPAKNPLNLYSSIRKEESMQRLSPAYSFARQVAKRTSAKVGLVVNARGGTSIAEWMPGTVYYDQLIQKAGEAAAFGIIKGVIWHQGESDLGKLDTYLADLEKLIQHIRADLARPQLPFVAGEIAEDQPGRDAFNRLIAQLPARVPHTAVVSSNGTKTFDKVHFDTKSQLKMGKRYAQKMKDLTHTTNEL
jgi:hypothetical protein